LILRGRGREFHDRYLLNLTKFEEGLTLFSCWFSSFFFLSRFFRLSFSSPLCSCPLLSQGLISPSLVHKVISTGLIHVSVVKGEGKNGMQRLDLEEDGSFSLPSLYLYYPSNGMGCLEVGLGVSVSLFGLSKTSFTPPSQLCVTVH